MSITHRIGPRASWIPPTKRPSRPRPGPARGRNLPTRRLPRLRGRAAAGGPARRRREPRGRRPGLGALVDAGAPARLRRTGGVQQDGGGGPRRRTAAGGREARVGRAEGRWRATTPPATSSGRCRTICWPAISMPATSSTISTLLRCRSPSPTHCGRPGRRWTTPSAARWTARQTGQPVRNATGTSGGRVRWRPRCRGGCAGCRRGTGGRDR